MGGLWVVGVGAMPQSMFQLGTSGCLSHLVGTYQICLAVVQPMVIHVKDLLINSRWGDGLGLVGGGGVASRQEGFVYTSIHNYLVSGSNGLTRVCLKERYSLDAQCG